MEIAEKYITILTFRRLLMKCLRCGGVMVLEKFYGTSEVFFGWRCITSGEIVDQVILENRLGQKR